MWPFDRKPEYFGANSNEFKSLLVGQEKDQSFGPVRCPKCGSPYMVRVPKNWSPTGGLEGFTCVAGDCGFVGAFNEYEITTYAPGWRKEYESLFSQPS